MGISKFLGLSSSSSSTPSSPTRRGFDPPSLGPGSSKVDYAFGLNSSGPSNSPGLAQSYYHGEDDAPPAYHPQGASDFHDWATDPKMPEPQTSAVHFPTPGRVDNPTNSMGEFPLQALFKYDIVIVLDDSYSMMIKDNAGGKTRWNQAWDALGTLVRVGVQYDRDGIEIHFLNKREDDATVKSVSDLEKLRAKAATPGRETHTPTGDVLDTLLLKYRNKTGNSPGVLGVKKRIFLVITDGVPTDAPEDVIINAANFFQRNNFPIDQVGIQFIQVGNDPGAGRFLDELDRELVGQMGEHARDIVDTVKSNGQDLKGDALIKALTGGFNRRQDRTGEKRSHG